MRDSEIFEKAVMRCFNPIAQELGLHLVRVSEGVFEIPSPHFIMRIRLHTGHQRGLNVLLRPASLSDFDEDQPGAEYGIGNFMLFNGERLEDTIFESDDLPRQTELLAHTAQRFLVPYLLGEKDDFEAIKEMVRRKTEEDLQEIKEYRFPKNVREEWHLPED